MTPSASLFAALLLTVSASALGAADPPAPDVDLPQPLDTRAAEQMLANPPFTRILNLAETLRLTGIAYVEGRPVATFLNTATKENIIISEVPNAQGWKIAGTIPSTNLQRTQVKIVIGGEIVTVGYGDEALSPGAAQKGAITSRREKYSSKRMKSSSLLGEGGREMYYSLSDQGRAKFKESMRQNMESQPDLSTEDRAAYAQKVFAELKAADQAGGAPSGNAPKARKAARTSTQ